MAADGLRPNGPARSRYLAGFQAATKRWSPPGRPRPDSFLRITSLAVRPMPLPARAAPGSAPTAVAGHRRENRQPTRHPRRGLRQSSRATLAVWHCWRWWHPGAGRAGQRPSCLSLRCWSVVLVTVLGNERSGIEATFAEVAYQHVDRAVGDHNPLGAGLFDGP
ncbi:hypothetical protein D3C81_1394170 [compost metagenome]